MARWIDRLDRTLGRLFFRAVGMVCAIVAIICGYAVWWHFTHWNPAYSLWPVIMFSVVALAAVSVLPHCFSRRRTFGEALDAMEGGAGDQHRPSKLS
jgi:membrane protein YdbS with pleckstrin-like domain